MLSGRGYGEIPTVGGQTTYGIVVYVVANIYSYVVCTDIHRSWWTFQRSEFPIYFCEILNSQLTNSFYSGITGYGSGFVISAVLEVRWSGKFKIAGLESGFADGDENTLCYFVVIWIGGFEFRFEVVRSGAGNRSTRAKPRPRAGRGARARKGGVTLLNIKPGL